MFYDVAMNFVIGTILMVAGAIMIWIPNRIFTGILIASIVFLCVNGVVLFIRFVKNKMNKDFFLFLYYPLRFMFFLNELSVSSTMDLASKLWRILYSLWLCLFCSACD